MDGSIADSTVLRMRPQLQRMHHSSPQSQSDGFLEELLKLPAAPLTIAAEETEAGPGLDDHPESTTAQLEDAAPATDKEPDEKEEVVDENIAVCAMPVCYAPAIDPPPSEIEETAQLSVESDTTVLAEPTVETTGPVQESVSQVETVVQHSDIAAAAETGAVSQQPVAEGVEVVDSNNAGLTSDQAAKTLRETRRPKETREKTVAPPDQLQPVAAQAVTDETKAALSVEKSDGATQAQTSSEPRDPLVAQPNQPTENRRDRGDARSQRDKWYENNGSAKVDGQSASLAERMQEMLAEQNTSRDDGPIDSASTEFLLEWSETGSELSASSTDISAQLSADSLQMASDIAAAAQANLNQSASAQRVAESTAASGVDSAGRGRGNPAPTIGATGMHSDYRSLTAQGTTSLASGSSADGSGEITQQERVRLVQRVARSFSRLGPEGGQVSLKLHPPQLGVLNVLIKIEGQTMTARLQTETSAARDVIIDNLPVLRDRLSEQGIEIEKFQVEVGQQEDMSSGSGQTGSFSGNNNSSQNGDTPTSTEFDYRRAARTNVSRQNIAAAAMMEPKLQGWPSVDRSLDVRA